jgi:MFS family permease
MAKSILNVFSVWKRQSRNWRTVSIVSLFNKFFQRMTQTYTPIYIKQLGADDIQLGIINSISNIVATGISAPVGWFQDRYSLKKIFIIGFMVSLLSTIVYGAATAWTTIIFAMGLSALVALRTSGAPAIGTVKQSVMSQSMLMIEQHVKAFVTAFLPCPRS